MTSFAFALKYEEAVRKKLTTRWQRVLEKEAVTNRLVFGEIVHFLIDSDSDPP